MTAMSLRFRVFLFFCLMALGALAIVGGGLWVGYQQVVDGGAFSSFMTVGLVATFGIMALVLFVWRLFDENVSKPIEQLASKLRLRANADVDVMLDPEMARYLGDLGPAAGAVNDRLGRAAEQAAEALSQKTARLEQQQAQLLRILSDIPVAVMVVNKDHQIVMYDGQAADLMERGSSARLNGSVFDYLDETTIRDALDQMSAEGGTRREIAIMGNCNELLSGHIRRFGENSGYTLMLEPLVADAARPLVYDFDLLEKPSPTDVTEAALTDLTFVVFDSETTGLDTERDQVVQLGAVRIVNGRIVPGEAFDTLVNPGIKIPRRATRVHHISNAMVADAPDFPTARTAFCEFSRSSVLVAHNAPFDMAFLHRGANGPGSEIDNPVLDTVHLSAIIFGGSAEHTLDALCERLNIEIAEDLRHTAMGDAVATAEAFVAMVPILEARGLRTFGQVRAEMKKHSRILKVQS